MSNYARANTTTAWYQDNFPGSAMKPNCGVIHTTEGTSLPGYSGGAVAPNYTAVPNFKEKRLHWYAHFPDERSSRALVNAPGGVETNTLNAVQVELVGTCDPSTHRAWARQNRPHIFWPEAPDWALIELARFLVDMHKRHGIPLDGPKDSRWHPYPDSAGPGGQRFSFAEWSAFNGWCGHQHVPENVHGDPGHFPFSKLVSFALDLMHPEAKKAGATPRWDHIWEAADAIASDPNMSADTKADAARVRGVAARHSLKH